MASARTGGQRFSYSESNVIAHPPHYSLLGLGALVTELADEGISADSLFARTGVVSTQLEDPNARISRRQRLAIYRNAVKLAPKSEIGLLAGARQRISDFGMYGYAMLSSKTFGDALRFSLDHTQLAGAVFDVRYYTEGNTSILCSKGTEQLGDLLPFVAEFWRSSITALFACVLESRFPSKRMVLSYEAPRHWRRYQEMFGCPVDFGAATMEWHFDSDVLEKPCPNANPITMQMCRQLCDSVLDPHPPTQNLISKVQAECLTISGELPPASEMAGRLGMSVRTLHRRLAALSCSYQTILDDVRRSLAIEFLHNTELSVEQIAERIGFADAVSFRKSFRKWTGHAPTEYRAAALLPQAISLSSPAR